ncbi:MAG: flagellar basal body rod protein FlgB [Gammaproteobacteria bacterium]|jgi:flagellar basal-body rod protein FlgB
MPTYIDQVFSGHERSLAVNRQRLEVVASNLANAETPAYKARDVDFRSAMRAAETEGVTLRATRPGHIAEPGDARPASLHYRTANQPSLDGNTVDSDKEKAAFAEASTRYQASLTFLSQRIRGLRLAITGSR